MNKLFNYNHPIITLGSPLGIGYEIFIMSLSNKIFKNLCPVCIGSKNILDYFIKTYKKKIAYVAIKQDKICRINEYINKIKFILINIDKNNYKIDDDIKRIKNKKDGYCAFKSIEAAANLIKSNIFKSIVTLPVNKKNINLIEPSFYGHTEYFQSMWNEKQVFMTFISKKINVLLLTTHIPLSSVTNYISLDLIKNGINAAIKLKERLKIIKDIIFLGVNPHAGENGLIGEKDEMIKEIIKQSNKINVIKIKGPVPSDTAFTKKNLNNTGLYISCYHDQGLIPFKIFSFKDGVNLSFGMKNIRTSVDHGTAIDLIGKKKADITSFINAYKIALKLS